VKTIIVNIDVFEKGDRVLTSNGMAIVTADEVLKPREGDKIDRMDLAYSEVPVKLDEACSGWSGRHGKMDASGLMIQKDEKSD